MALFRWAGLLIGVWVIAVRWGMGPTAVGGTPSCGVLTPCGGDLVGS